MTESANTRARRAANDWYRAVWRWHFYAGLLVIPWLISLAITGALYLFHDDIDRWWHADTLTVTAQSGPTLAPHRQVAAALASRPGEALRFVPAPRSDLASEVDVRAADGTRHAVYVDPYSGEVTGSLPYRGSLMWTIRHLHSLSYFGSAASLLIELAAGWAILLVLTGLYLWWPRGRRDGVVTVRARPAKRVFWRDLHAVTGLFVGGFILFLAITGMPWSTLWGTKVNELANGHNYGYPDGVRVDVPMSDARLADRETTNWSLEQARLPESAGDARGAAPIGLDAAVATFRERGLAPGFAVNLPDGSGGVYTGSAYPDDLSRQRVVHLDQYSGRPLLDMGYADYGPVGRGLEWGINVHLGQQYGLANKLILALACAGIVLLCVSSAVMWWKRRPTGRLGVPPEPRDPRRLRGVLVLLAIGGVIFPLVGASLVIMALVDALWRRRVAQRTALA
ncbi:MULTISPECIES: PepSY domain-containing protein [unclassified Modicisalibacter]|uniref:PepSY-associated TM helix domain-containing protein n=1 Tax=unclassified Modicisalibacter TaxID=2679913 RepID=UPI001CCF3218|nr:MULTISPECIES: PepSY domain-containing protein [unclassified Modicisalibacter]MBZ9558914.1 PepSY domain-containing protein [Modicisalibacter sp. R2A 31.J]MBZ9575194.1 PepSY domain-containing protein [Modicisalibacter sp. MOD 31.J]